MKKREFILPIIFIVVLPLLLLSATPVKNERNTFFVVKKGETLNNVIQRLSDENYIYSPLFARSYFHFLSEDIKAGTYYFEPKKSLIGLANQLVTADYGIESIKVTLPEGVNVYQVAHILNDELPGINGEDFLNLAQGSEGYLFPDTYLFSPDDDEAVVFEKLLQTFDEKTMRLFEEAGISEDPEAIYDTLKLASIIEEEAKNPRDRRLISGVLKNRLEIGMALQVDVTFQYINGKNTYELTEDDLKDPSLYNTYVHRGLPPTPISNPGLDSIDAALNPIENEYLYFLAGRDGTTYFSETFDEHVKKKFRYL